MLCKKVVSAIHFDNLPGILISLLSLYGLFALAMGLPNYKIVQTKGRLSVGFRRLYHNRQ